MTGKAKADPPAAAKDEQQPKAKAKRQKRKAINQSLRPSGFAPAFGRAVAALRLA
jgi:hypothetical protein